MANTKNCYLKQTISLRTDPDDSTTDAFGIKLDCGNFTPGDECNMILKGTTLVECICKDQELWGWPTGVGDMRVNLGYGEIIFTFEYWLRGCGEDPALSDYGEICDRKGELKPFLAQCKYPCDINGVHAWCECLRQAERRETALGCPGHGLDSMGPGDERTDCQQQVWDHFKSCLEGHPHSDGGPPQSLLNYIEACLREEASKRVTALGGKEFCHPGNQVIDPEEKGNPYNANAASIRKTTEFLKKQARDKPLPQ